MDKSKKVTRFKRQTGTQWTDNNGLLVDIKRITPLERLRERWAKKLANAALQVEKSLFELKEIFDQGVTACYEAFINDLDVTPEGHKNHLFYDFAQTIKIDHTVQQDVDYDPNLMIMAYEHMKQFAQEYDGEEQEKGNVFAEMLLDSIKMSKGRFDNRKIASVLSYEDDPRVKKNPHFKKAIHAIKKAQKNTGVRMYDKVYIKEKGKWRLVLTSYTMVEKQVNDNTITEASKTDPAE